MLTIEPLEQKNKKLNNIIFAVFILVSTVFLYIAEQYEKNPISIESKIQNSLDFKLSADDIVNLNESFNTKKWVSVKLIESKQIFHSVKLKHKSNSILDLQFYCDGDVYNLYRFENSRKYIFSFFKTAENWGLRSTNPQLVKVKLNEILFGVYIMEKKIYEKIKDNRGDYFITLGSNTEKIKTMLYLISQTDGQMVEKYFNKKELAAYFIYFSLFCYNEIFNFDRLLFHYNAKKKMLQPFLTLDSILASLFEQDKVFKFHIGKAKNFFTRITRENTANLLARPDDYKYGELIKKVLR
jgi:hypothetical protein